MRNKIKRILERELIHADFFATPGVGVLQHKDKHIERIIDQMLQLFHDQQEKGMEIHVKPLNSA